MGERPVICALVDKYAEFSGRLRDCEGEAKKLKMALTHLHAVIGIFKGNFDVKSIAPRRKYTESPHFGKEGYLRVCLEVLKEAQEPLASRQIALLALQRRGVTEDDPKALKRISDRITTSLVKMVKQGRMNVVPGSFPRRFSKSENRAD